MKIAEFNFKPVIIIGAGRSGTNALRDMLTRMPGFASWDCDEINPIWRHGNLAWPNDEIPRENATATVRKFIRNAFQKIWLKTGKPEFIVEKTCANSLRVPFVDAVIPEAKYIYIVRSGTDVVASASKRWRGDLEIPRLPYFLSKVRYTPITDLPIYGWSFLKSRIKLLLGRSERLSLWGPRFNGMRTVAGGALTDICAYQWAACVESSDRAFAEMDPTKVLSIKYERLASEPRQVLEEILTFLGVEANTTNISNAVAPVRATSINRGQELQRSLSAESLDAMLPLLRKHGYDRR